MKTCCICLQKDSNRFVKVKVQTILKDQLLLIIRYSRKMMWKITKFKEFMISLRSKMELKMLESNSKENLGETFQVYLPPKNVNRCLKKFYKDLAPFMGRKG